MLKLIGLAVERKVSRRVDEYVPFCVTLGVGPSSIDEAFYWRSTGPEYLLELKIDARTGAIAEISLVLVPRERVVRVKAARPELVPIDRGVPLVDVEPWKKRIAGREIGVDPELRRIDEAVPFMLGVGPDGVAVRFEGVGEPARIAWNDDVGFLFTEERLLVGVVLAGLTERERELVLEHGTP